MGYWVNVYCFPTGFSYLRGGLLGGSLGGLLGECLLRSYCFLVFWGRVIGWVIG